MRILKSLSLIVKASCALFVRGELSHTTKSFQIELRKSRIKKTDLNRFKFVLIPLKIKKSDWKKCI